MLKDILKIINKENLISKTQIAKELDINIDIIEEGINQLLRMKYLVEDKTGKDCITFCSGCPYAKTCHKEILKTFKISDKGKKYLL